LNHSCFLSLSIVLIYFSDVCFGSSGNALTFTVVFFLLLLSLIFGVCFYLEFKLSMIQVELCKQGDLQTHVYFIRSAHSENFHATDFWIMYYVSFFFCFSFHNAILDCRGTTSFTGVCRWTWLFLLGTTINTCFSFFTQRLEARQVN
jgi:hypothetical protein